MKHHCKVSHVCAPSLGMALGLVGAIGVLLLSLGAALFGWWMEPIEMVSKMYMGYSTGFVGTLIGIVWAFVDGFVGGWLIGFFYNMINRKCAAKCGDADGCCDEGSCESGSCKSGSCKSGSCKSGACKTGAAECKSEGSCKSA